MLLELVSWRRGRGKFNGISHAIRMVVVVVAIFLGVGGRERYREQDWLSPVYSGRLQHIRCNSLYSDTPVH